MVEKKCFKCGATKPLSEFYKHPQMADGHLGKCKECTKKDVRNRRMEFSDYYREYDRKRGNRQDYSYLKKYREKNPEKEKAHRLLNYGVRNGKVVKQLNCQECGSSFAIEAHHEDYSKPLDVVWLCSACHKRRHHPLPCEVSRSAMDTSGASHL